MNKYSDTVNPFTTEVIKKEMVYEIVLYINTDISSAEYFSYIVLLYYCWLIMQIANF